MINRELYLRAMHKRGISLQKVMIIEECSELIQAIVKDIRGQSGNYAQIAEEIADVQIMLEQAIVIYDLEKQVAEFKEDKLMRLEGRLD